MIDWENFGNGILHIAMTIYLLTGALSFYGAYRFYKSIDGRLRVALIEFFFGLGCGVAIRGIWGFLEVVVRAKSNPYISLLVILIVFVTLMRFLIVVGRINNNTLSK